MLAVVGAGLEQRHLELRVLAQARGDDGAGGAAAHDDVVVLGDRVLGRQVLIGHVFCFLSGGSGQCVRGNHPETAGSVFS